MSCQTNNSSEWAVRVDCHGSAPKQLSPQDICKIFQDHVGPVSRVSENLEGGKKWIKVVFGTYNEQKKALCMTGYSIGGTSIQVSSLSTKPSHPFPKYKGKGRLKTNRTSDTRRNLYVLNLPHDLSAQAYHDLFAAHGTPTHTVLLKTHDSCSRRRGFVVMSTHDEAQTVITWLDGVCIRGFQLRITWANIDRSNGFLSGYDRSTFSQDENPSMQPATSLDTAPAPECPGFGMDTSTIVASNIPSSLFPAPEIDILFKPFGVIKKIQLVPLTPSPSPSAPNPVPNTLAQTVIVTYEKAADAITAKNTLHGQIYDGFTVAVGFISRAGKDESGTPHSICLTPFMPSTIASVRQNYHRGPLPALPSTEGNFCGLPSASQELNPFRYGTNLIPSRSHDWMPYTPLVPQNFDLQFQRVGNSSAFPCANNSMPFFPSNHQGHDSRCHANYSSQFQTFQ